MADAEAGGLGRSPVGERLRAAREAAGLSLDDVAARTRIPTRHLDAMETGAWSRLPGPTYVSGFAKTYADVVGLERVGVGEEIRAEMGSGRAPVAADTFQPADPARVPPRTLAIGAAVLAVLAGGAVYFVQRDALDEVEPAYIATPEPARVERSRDTPTPAPAPTGPVVLTAREPVWVQVRERGGTVFASRELKAGERIEVPATAQDPILRTGHAELINVTVGGRPAPTLGPANQLIRDRSLRPDAVLAAAAAPAGLAPQNPLMSSEVETPAAAGTRP